MSTHAVRATTPTMISGIPILTYHSLDDSGSVISIAPAKFKWQMEWLQANGYHAMSLAESVQNLRKGAPFPAKTFVLTFDDGYQNIHSHALPVLQQFGWNATVFLITDYCGKLNDWSGHSSAVARCPLLSWTQVEEMQRHGFEFGAHTRTHPDLRRLSIEEARREMAESKAEIEARLGTRVSTFAYPYGFWNEQVKELAAQHFEVACSTRLGKVKPDCDLQLLPRIDIYYLTDDRLFSRISTHSMDRYLQLRQWLRDLKTINSPT